jgi:hydroxyethylthiazole kinase
MTNKAALAADLLILKHNIRNTGPLIHCLTNPISINDCANIVLAAGARPIMAEHPAEVAQITSASAALAVNLGNVTDARLKSMMISGNVSRDKSIPSIIDLVGIACSDFRLKFAQKFITECQPNVLKGNISELKALAGLANDACGIDAGSSDGLSSDTITILQTLARKNKSVIIASGATDIVTDGTTTFLGSNGNAMLTDITGTGCMLNVLTAACIFDQNIFNGCLLAITFLGISGELAAENSNGPGTFRAALLDVVYNMTDEEFANRLKLEKA